MIKKKYRDRNSYTPKEFLDLQIKAIDQSIEKWKNIVFHGAYDRGAIDCKCCMEFECPDCPIFEFNKTFCDNTEYGEWTESTDSHRVEDECSRNAANHMLTSLYEAKHWLTVKRYHEGK